MMRPKMIPRTSLVLVLILVCPGCERDGSDLHPVVTDLIQKQAAQQESLVRQSERLTDASRQLVTADSEARRELLELQSTLQSDIANERQALDRQRDGLEDERRVLAQQRHRDPLIAAALIQGATLVVAALPILLIVVLIRGARHESADAAMGEILLEELRNDRPRLECDASDRSEQTEWPRP